MAAAAWAESQAVREALAFAANKITIGNEVYRDVKGMSRYVQRRYGGVKRKFRGTYGRYRKRARTRAQKMKVGNPIGAGNAKRTEVERSIGAFEVQFNNILYFYDISLIAQGTNLDERTRALVNLAGWRFCMEFKNNSAFPMYMNVAILAPKTSTLLSQTEFEDSFFRAHTGNSRTIDFTDPSLRGMDRHCRPINADKFVILKHKRFRLSAINETLQFTDPNRPNHKFYMWYTKFGRQLRWKFTGSGSGEEVVYLAYWFTTFNQPAGGGAGTETVNVNRDIVAYWREPKR